METTVSDAGPESVEEPVILSRIPRYGRWSLEEKTLWYWRQRARGYRVN